jgi:uncharacterized protein
MRIGVISDTHLQELAPKLPKGVINAFKDVQMIIHCGDITELNVLDELKNICPEVRAVQGNMDSEEVKGKLPLKDIFFVGKFKLALTHGRGAPVTIVDTVLNEFKQEKPDIIIFGHTHFPVNEKREGVILFNPGSAMDKVYAKFNSCGIIELNDKIETKIIKI